MTAHKNRAGYLIISWDCKNGRHGDACQVDVKALDIEDPIVCHCDCHPECKRPECQKVGPQKHVKNETCPNCYEQVPLTGICDNCG